jgi:transcriptional regulator with XRE-family HTH domain
MKVPDSAKKGLGLYLQDKRIEAGLTQAQVATHLGFSSPQFVSNWERGLAFPAFDTLPVLAKLYKIPAGEFIDALAETYQKALADYRKELVALFRNSR